jgi:predicted dehydrogenase
MNVQQFEDRRVQQGCITSPIGVAILGCGYWGINYVRVFKELTQSNVIVVCDQNADRLAEIAQRFPDVQVTQDVEAALSIDGVHAAIVCTPATTHYDLTRDCLLANKHVLIEKPITNTVDEADSLTDLAHSRDLTLMVGHTFLYNPGIIKVKEYIQRGDIGRLYYLYSRRTNMGPIRHDVNALWDLAPHDVSIFNYLLESTPDWISAVGAKVLRNGHEDVGFISLGYPSDVIAHIHVSWTDAYKVREVVAVGSEKRIVFNECNPLERVRVFDKGVSVIEPEAATYGEYQLRIRDGDILSPRIDASEPLKNQCLHFLDCINKRTRPLTDGWMGREVIRIMNAIDQSVENRGAPVELKTVPLLIGSRH